MMLFGLGFEFANSTVKSILNNKGEISIVLESGEVFTQAEVEKVLFYNE